MSERPSDVAPFSVDTWDKIQSTLSVAERVMGRLADEHGMELLGNMPYHGGGGWPARRLRSRLLLVIHEIRIVLNMHYLQDGKVFYELQYQRMIDLAEVYRKLLKHETIAEYSTEQVLDERLLTKDLETLIEQNRT